MSNLDEIKLYVFHHHHYIDIPADHEKYKASMIDYPNASFDAEGGTSSTTGTSARSCEPTSWGSTASPSTSTSAWSTA